MAAYFVLLVLFFVLYVGANFVTDPEVRRNIRIAAIVVYLGSGIAAMSWLVVAITVFFSVLLGFQTRLYYKQDKERHERLSS